jgi:DNA-binding FadR family transcriptional regulator
MLISAELIETRPGRGTYVSAAGSSEPVKIKIAPPLKRVEALREAVERMDAAAADPYDCPEADVDFHHALAEAAGNRYLVKAMLDLRSLLSPLRAGRSRGRRGARLIA